MNKEFISNEDWSKILNFLKGTAKVYIGQEADCKLFVEGVFWIARSGAPWRMLPSEYGNWNTVFARFNDWSKKEIWSGLLDYCKEDPDFEYIMIDSTIVRAHACSAGYGVQEEQGLGRSKGGFSSKIHVAVDALGNPLKFVITPGQRNDITQAEALLDNNLEGSHILGDKGYDSKALREHIKVRGGESVIPSRANSNEPVEYDKHIYKERHLVECFFSKIKHFRHVFSRFDKSARNFVSFLAFVGAFIWLR